MCCADKPFRTATPAYLFDLGDLLPIHSIADRKPIHDTIFASLITYSLLPWGLLCILVLTSHDLA